MATFLLIRHGTTDLIGRAIPGRMSGVHINGEGEAEVERLAERLASVPLDLICSSPMERTRETASRLARPHGLEVRICEGLNEVDAGEWTGLSIEKLVTLEKWNHYNLFRAGTRVPGGELMVEVQSRMAVAIERLREEYPEGVVAVVSHGDPIKAAIAHYIGVPLDLLQRIEISPASVSILSINDYGARLLCVNHTGTLPRF